MVVETNGAPDARGRRARERRMRDARKKKTMFTPARSPSRRAASPAFDPSMRHRSSDRAIRPIASRPPPPLATPRAWMVARVDDHSRRRARDDDARRRDERRDARYQKYIAPIASSRASSRVAFVAVRPIHPSIRARARALAGGRPPARTTVDIPRADCASHARGKSIDTHVGPGGSPSHLF